MIHTNTIRHAKSKCVRCLFNFDGRMCSISWHCRQFSLNVIFGIFVELLSYFRILCVFEKMYVSLGLLLFLYLYPTRTKIFIFVLCFLTFQSSNTIFTSSISNLNERNGDDGSDFLMFCGVLGRCCMWWSLSRKGRVVPMHVRGRMRRGGMIFFSFLTAYLQMLCFSHNGPYYCTFYRLKCCCKNKFSYLLPRNHSCNRPVQAVQSTCCMFAIAFQFFSIFISEIIRHWICHLIAFFWGF